MINRYLISSILSFILHFAVHCYFNCCKMWDFLPIFVFILHTYMVVTYASKIRIELHNFWLASFSILLQLLAWKSAAKSTEKLVNQKLCNTVLILDAIYIVDSLFHISSLNGMRYLFDFWNLKIFDLFPFNSYLSRLDSKQNSRMKKLCKLKTLKSIFTTNLQHLSIIEAWNLVIDVTLVSRVHLKWRVEQKKKWHFHCMQFHAWSPEGKSLKWRKETDD